MHKKYRIYDQKDHSGAVGRAGEHRQHIHAGAQTGRKAKALLPGVPDHPPAEHREKEQDEQLNAEGQLRRGVIPQIDR